MRKEVEIGRSRIMATAESLGTMAPDSHCFTNKAVLLTGESETLATANGWECLLNSFRLLIRMVSNLTVCLPNSEPLLDALRIESNRIAYRVRPKILVGEVTDVGVFDAVLCVGTKGQPALPWTTINSNGWLARVSSHGNDISADCFQANPIGALGAACLGVAEIFKRLIALRPERGELSPGLTFSFYDYRESATAGPALPTQVPVDLVLFGAGAIGNGIVHLLSVLPVVGRMNIVDRQPVQEENWGTYILVGPGDFGIAKAEWASSILQSKLTTGWLCGSVEEYVEQCGKSVQFPPLILNGLDNVPARRAVQRLWPDQIIDGAIGPTVCEVTIHPWEGNLSCLCCDFEEPVVEAVAVQALSTGLLPGRLAEPFALVEAADVEAAPAVRKDWLRSRQGKTICSVVSEGVLAALSMERQNQGFEPSAPFVACLSACMVVAEMVRYCLGWQPVLQTGFQFDSLVGPQNGILKIHHRKPDCDCVARRRNIEMVRSRRQGSDDAGASFRE